MTEPIHDYDPAQALEGREAIAVFFADALETETPLLGDADKILDFFTLKIPDFHGIQSG